MVARPGPEIKDPPSPVIETPDELNTVITPGDVSSPMCMPSRWSNTPSSRWIRTCFALELLTCRSWVR